MKKADLLAFVLFTALGVTVVGLSFANSGSASANGAQEPENANANMNANGNANHNGNHNMNHNMSRR